MLRKLIKYKILVVAALLLFLACILFFLCHVEKVPCFDIPINKSWIVTLSALAQTFLASAIISFTYEWFIRKEADDNLKKILLLNPEILNNFIGKTEKLNEIIKTILGVKLKNEGMGSELHDSIITEICSYTEYYYNFTNDIHLRECSDFPEYFDVISDLKYKTKLRNRTFIFGRTTDIQVHDSILKKGQNLYTFYLPESHCFPKGSKDAFDVLKFSINNIEIEKKEITNKDGIYEIIFQLPKSLRKYMNKKVLIQYSVRNKVSKIGHVLYYNAIKPTKGMNISVDGSETSINRIRAYDYIVSKQTPIITYDNNDPLLSRTVRVYIDEEEWVFPKSGIVFSWNLKEELKINFHLKHD